jgi:hypothetical protein
MIPLIILVLSVLELMPRLAMNGTVEFVTADHEGAVLIHDRSFSLANIGQCKISFLECLQHLLTGTVSGLNDQAAESSLNQRPANLNDGQSRANQIPANAG